MYRRVLLSLLAAMVFTASAAAEIKLPAFVSDHMVLQRDKELPIWGWADPGTQVTVTIAGQKAIATTNSDGRWRLKLKPLSVGEPRTLRVSDGEDEIVVLDVLVGDVWLCSGQSNMAMNVKGVVNADQEIAKADYPEIRHFKTGANARAAEPQSVCDGRWELCGPETVGSFTATGYFFARHLHQALDVPIGLINSSWGGTCVEAWTPREALASTRPGRDAIAAYEKMLANYDAAAANAKYADAVSRYEEQLAKYRQARKTGKAKGKPPRKPQPMAAPDRNQNSPSALYNGMIQPIVPYAIRGAIWYQGERNARTVDLAVDYRQLMPSMIRSWRKVWGKDDFPFFFVQLPNWRGEPWPAIRESFLETLKSTPHTGMAITIDVGDPSDIHPKNKQAVGRRLALSALHVAYGRDLAHSGPIFKSMAVQGSKVRLNFEYVFDGLVAKGGDELSGFVISGEDKQFVPAHAVIDGQSVVVSSDKVAKPVAVRYAWEANPTCNLFNKAGLPASPFRTDNWTLQQ